MTAWTQADLVQLEKAIATGTTKVRFADGREVTYRELADMWTIRREIIAALSGGIDETPRQTYVEHCRD